MVSDISINNLMISAAAQVPTNKLVDGVFFNALRENKMSDAKKLLGKTILD